MPDNHWKMRTHLDEIALFQASKILYLHLFATEPSRVFRACYGDGNDFGNSLWGVFLNLKGFGNV